MGRWEYWALTGVALCTLALVASIHVAYTGETVSIGTEDDGMHLFPYHVDEWQHLGLSQYVLEEGRLPFVNPYIDSEPSKHNFEVGFHLLTALILFILPVSPVRLFAFLPAIFAALSVLAMYYLLRGRYDARTSLFGAALLPFVPSSVNITGFWFYTPLTASIPVLLVLLGHYQRHGRSWTLYLSSAVLLALYPPSWFLLVFIVGITEFLHGTTEDKWLIGAGFATLAFATYVLQDLTVFTQAWQRTFAVEYFPFTLISPVVAFLAVLGAIHGYSDSDLLLVWPVVTGVLLLVYAVFDLSVLIPYPRALFLFLVGVIPLAAVGLEMVVEPLSRPGTSVAIVFLTVVLLSQYHTVEDERFRLQDFIGEDDYDLLQRVDTRVGDNATILAQPHFSTVIYPVTGSHVVALPDSLLAYGDPRTYRAFLRGSCAEKRGIVRSESVDVVITAARFNCDGFTEKLSGSRFVYEVV